jgi:hypothetical protein
VGRSQRIRDAIGHATDFTTMLGTGKMTIDQNRTRTYGLAIPELADGKNELAK